MRFARLILRVQLAGMAVGAAVLVYVLGFDVHPHQVGYGCLIAACYVALSGVVTFFMQRAWRVQARRAAAAAARGVDVGVPTENVGVVARGLRKGLLNQRRTWLSVMLLGVAMLIAFLELVNHYEGSALAFQPDVVNVQGVVTGVTGPGLPAVGGTVDVQYVYAGQTLAAHVYRADTGPAYQVGEAVTVTVDPSDPHIATVGGSDNLGPAVVWLLVALLVGGGCAVFLGLVTLLLMGLARRGGRGAPVKVEHPA
jgi:hypothetical protein